MDPLTPRVTARFKKAAMAARVVSRFKEAAGPSRGALAFLTKSAKGIKGGFDIDALKEALPLIGWSIEDTVVAVPIDGEKAAGQIRPILTKHGLGKYDYFHGGLKEEKVLYVLADTDGKALFDDIKAFVTESSAPTSIKVGEVVLKGFKLDREGQAGRWLLKFMESWVGVEGWTVKSPKGSVTFTPKMSYTGRMEPLAEKGSDRFWTFAYKAGLKEAATAFLASMGTDVVQDILKPVDPRTLQNTGTCPACFMNTKMIKGRMIRHGWQVGGRRQRGVWGLTWHSGPCFGVGYQPFELSPEGTKAYVREALVPALAQTEDKIGKLKSRPLKLTVEIKGKPEEIDESHQDYERHLKTQLNHAEQTMKGLEAEHEDLKARINTWKLQPLPGTPEWRKR
jgi:hypothetical protein